MILQYDYQILLKWSYENDLKNIFIFSIGILPETLIISTSL